MVRLRRALVCGVLLALTLAAGLIVATHGAAAQSANSTARIVAATNAFLATLNDTQRKAVQYDWSNTAQKQRWSNLPQGLFDRQGLQWASMTAPQRAAWLTVMRATLSSEGYDRVIKEWNADEALAAQQAAGAISSGPGSSGGLLFGAQYYFIAIIGTPSETSPWQWQWGGHHVTINATVVGPRLSLNPSFIGVQPGTYRDVNGQTVRPLGDIEDESLALVKSLDATQQKAAILGSSVIDLVLGPGQDNKTIQPEGLPGAQMTAAQQTQFLQLIAHYTGLANDDAAAARMAEVKSHLNETYFAWYGPTTKPGSGYFRVTGPTIVIEFAPQGGGGGSPGGTPGAGGPPGGTPGAGGTPGGTPGAGGPPGGTPGAGGPPGGGAGSSSTAVVGGATPGTGAVGTPGVVATAVAIGAEHVHGIYRDPTNDYGAAYLAGLGPSAGSGATASPVAENTPAPTPVAIGMPSTGNGDPTAESWLWLVGLLALAVLAGGGLLLRSRAGAGTLKSK